MLIAPVMPRLVPAIQTLSPPNASLASLLMPCPLQRRSTYASFSVTPASELTRVIASFNVCPSNGLPGSDFMPTTKLSVLVEATETWLPNSYFLCTVPLAMHATSWACTG